MSVREYAVLYLGPGGKPGAASGGGNVVLTGGGNHALDGPEHTTPTPSDDVRLDATTDAHGLLPKLSGNAGHVLLGDGTFAPFPNPTLDDLADVDTTGVGDGDVLVYDLATTTWVPGAAGTGSGLSAAQVAARVALGV